MKILKIVFLLISMVSVDLMSMEIDQSPKFVAKITEEIKSVQILAGGRYVFLLLNGLTYFADYNEKYEFDNKFTALNTSSRLYSHIAVTTNYFAAAYEGAKDKYNLLIWDTKYSLVFKPTPYDFFAHRMPITGLYGSGKDYFVSSSDFPNFKIWHVTKDQESKSNKIKIKKLMK